MSKEIYISTTPHETRLAIVEEEQLAEVYFERENEYTLAGSIYNGKVTRVLPGMQSSFVDIGLERDAFLYVTDFMEEAGDSADFDSADGGGRRPQPVREAAELAPREGGRNESPRRDEGGRGRGRGGRDRSGREQVPPVVAESGETEIFEEPVAPRPVEPSAAAEVSGDEESEEQGSRRWRGRRGRRRGRGGREGAAVPAGEGAVTDSAQAEEAKEPEGFADEPERLSLEGAADEHAAPSMTGAIEIDVEAEPRAPENGRGGSRFGGDRGRGGRDRGGDRGGRFDRGRGDRSGRDGERAPVERRPAAIAEVEEVAEAAGEPVVLPGESIRKYRDPAEVAAEDAVRRPAESASVMAASAPAIEIVGWDGGAVLPGEMLSRHRGRDTAARSDESRGQERRGGRVGASSRFAAPTRYEVEPAAARQVMAEPWPPVHPAMAATAEEVPEAVSLQAFALTPVSAVAKVHEEGVAPSPIADVEEIAAAAAPEETGGLTQHPAHADESAAIGSVVSLKAGTEELPESVAEKPEYEPVEGEAASVGDSGRRDYRRLEQRPEVDSEMVAGMPDATTYDLPEELAQVPLDMSREADQAVKEGREAQRTKPKSWGAVQHEPFNDDAMQHYFTSLPSTGEMVDVPSAALVDDAGHLPRAQDADEPILAETAMQASVLAGHDGLSETSPENGGGFEVGRVLDVDEDEPMHDGTLVIDGFPFAQTGDAVPQVHAYGDGDLEEEEVDGDEYEYDLAVASTEEDEFEDYEEETLDGSDAIDSVMEEMSLGEGDVADEEDREYPAESAAGEFTVDDFGGEPTEMAEAAPATQNGGERRGRRDGGRDGRRGGRDRDRRPGGGFRGGASAAASGDRDRGRGRGRQSVQTMDLPAINELLKPGQEVLLQIAKEPIAKKGARVTSHIALPGRFLVFMPTVNHTGVSRKISSDEERRRLKTILLSEKAEATGGFIVRTAAEGASEEELRNDLRFLIQLWQDIKARSESSKSPALIYHDLSLIERILRDQVTDNFSAIWVDTEAEYERVLRFLQRFQPSLVRRVKLYTKETPMFEHFGVTAEIDRALKSKVWLKSGGSIVIDQTEALVAIDINTGKYVGKTARLEDTILKTNLDAIPEIVRQIRLRDLGGIIVIDFIDMDDRRNRARVMQVLEEELKNDRAPSKVLPFNDFGLVIMTRKRVKQSLERTLCIPDPITEGTGMIKSPITVANEIYIEMRKMQRQFEKGDVMLRVHPEVVKTLKLNGGKRLQELEEMTRKTILVKSDPALNPEQFDIH